MQENKTVASFNPKPRDLFLKALNGYNNHNNGYQIGGGKGLVRSGRWLKHLAFKDPYYLLMHTINDPHLETFVQQIGSSPEEVDDADLVNALDDFIMRFDNLKEIMELDYEGILIQNEIACKGLLNNYELDIMNPKAWELTDIILSFYVLGKEKKAVEIFKYLKVNEAESFLNLYRCNTNDKEITENNLKKIIKNKDDNKIDEFISSYVDKLQTFLILNHIVEFYRDNIGDCSKIIKGNSLELNY